MLSSAPRAALWLSSLASVCAAAAAAGDGSESAPLECSAAWAINGLPMLPGLSHTGHSTGANWSGYGPTERKAWRAVLDDTRAACRRNFDANSSAFADPRLQWTQTNYVSPQMHPYDRTFYDPALGYTVGKYLADVEARYGGVDSILLWPTYPNIGVDNRNQIDLFRAMPGGLPAVRKVVGELKARGVRVLLPYNPWDVATRREGLGKITDDVALAELIKAVSADGRENGIFFGVFPMFVPSLSWQNDRFYI